MLSKKSSPLKRKEVYSLRKVVEIIRVEKRKGKKVGLITGCFDILHLGHVNLFRFAKKHVDFLVVGVEKDETIRNSKGKKRPFNKLEWRCQVLSEIDSIDIIFPIETVFKYDDLEGTAEKYTGIYKKIDPDFLITNIVADKFWKEKRKIANKIGIKLLGQKSSEPVSSSAIISGILKKL